MAKYTQKTRIMFGDQDVSNSVVSTNLPRIPNEVEQVQLTLVVDKLEVVDGVLVIHIELPEEF